MRASVLVVDDEPSVCESLALALEDMALVRTAPSAREALDILTQLHVDVVLLDFKMPGLNGLDFLKRIQRVNPNIPVVMMTATTDVGLALRTFRQGAVNYITKPFDLQHLQNVLEGICAGQRRARILKHEQYVARMQPLLEALPELLDGFAPQVSDLQAGSCVVLKGASQIERELLALWFYQHHQRREQMAFLNAKTETDSARHVGLVTDGLWFLEDQGSGRDPVADALQFWLARAALPSYVFVGAGDDAELKVEGWPLLNPRLYALPDLQARPIDQRLLCRAILGETPLAQNAQILEQYNADALLCLAGMETASARQPYALALKAGVTWPREEFLLALQASH